MKNFLTDNQDILFHLEHLDLDRIIGLKEENFSQAKQYPHAPTDADDARDSYRRVLAIVGEIAAGYMSPNAATVDERGPSLADNQVTFHPVIHKTAKILAQADLTGFCIPRQYKGLNMPVITLCMALEIMARADASFLNFGLQQCIAGAINKFASEDQKQSCLPKLGSGEWDSSMMLSEPDAGSDLQSIRLRATLENDGTWYLNGVKHFISNGCSSLSLILARSEENIRGARGLSLFLYKRDEKMLIRRVENKLGLRGSATCELQFNHARAELIGQRQRGLITYTLWLMNHARLGVAAQALGIAEAAFREADQYAAQRIQFGTAIGKFAPVFEMLGSMQVSLEACRSLLYETACFTDLNDSMGEKKYARYAGFLVPLVKAYASEMANKLTYNAIQIHGGAGCMKECNVQRHYRDARITSIYEGTTQLQITAAIGAITSGTAQMLLDEYDRGDYPKYQDMVIGIRECRNIFDKTLEFVLAERSYDQFLAYHSQRLAEMACDLVIAWLLLRDAQYSERKHRITEIFVTGLKPRIFALSEFIINEKGTLLRNYKRL